MSTIPQPLPQTSAPLTQRPARIVLATFGSLGDLHPYMAIGLELQRRGHTAVIATSNKYRDKVLATGLSFAPVRPDFPEDPAEYQAIVRKAMDLKDGTRYILREMVMPQLRDSHADLLAACDGADLLVGHPLTLSARLISEKTGLPWISSVLQPISFFSSEEACVYPQAPVHKLRVFGAGFYRLVHNLLIRSMRSWSQEWHHFRAELGLPPTSDDPLFAGQHSPKGILALFSSVLAAPQRDWPPRAVVTGFPFYDLHETAEPSSACEDFLKAGPPPFLFTLGSAAVHDPGNFYEVAVDATRQLQQRAILLIGQEHNRPQVTHGSDIFMTNYLPFSQVMPRCAVLVHQGGVGTTAQALRAGRPQLVMPYAHDQPDNAHRVEKRGAGRQIPRKDWTPKRVAQLLRELLENPTYPHNAQAIATKIAQENGTKTAADTIEQHLQ